MNTHIPIATHANSPATIIAARNIGKKQTIKINLFSIMYSRGGGTKLRSVRSSVKGLFEGHWLPAPHDELQPCNVPHLLLGQAHGVPRPVEPGQFPLDLPLAHPLDLPL